MPVEIAVASISPVTVRITVAPSPAPAACRTMARSSRRRKGSRWRGGGRPTRSRRARGQSHRALHRRPAGHPRRHRQRDNPSSAWDSAPTSRACRSCCPRDRCSASARAGRSSIARDRRSDAQRPGRVSAQDARRTRAHPVAGGDRRVGHVRPSPARRVRFHRRRGPLTPGGRCAAARRVHRGVAGSDGHPRRIRAHHRPCGAAAAVVVRLPAVASHAGRARRGDVGREDVPREEAAVRRADLSRHGVHAVGMEHAQRRVRLEEGELPGSEEGHRRSARAALQGRAALGDRRPAHERHRRRMPARRTRPCRADARRTIAGPRIARSNATGRITSR